MSLNDPQWGKRGNGGGGPPDLDEIWRNVNRRMGELFGRKGDDGSGGGDRPPRHGMAMGGAGLLVALVLIVWLASGFYIVDEGRRGVVTHFGKYTETTLPGPRWHLPFPVEAVELVDFSQVKTVEIGYRNSPKNKVDKEAVMLTDDENIIDIQFAVQYNIKNAEAYVFNNRKPDAMVAFVAETAIREVVGKSKMDFALYEGREQIAKQTERIMQETLDRYKTGVYIQKVTLQNVQPPDKVQAAFDDAVKAGQDRVRLVNEGQAYANDVVPRARGNASRLMEEAKVRAVRVREGAWRHARPAVHRHDAVGAGQHDQGAHRPEGRRQPSVPAARQADPAERRRRRRGDPRHSSGGRARHHRHAAAGRARGHARPQPVARRHAQP